MKEDAGRAVGRGGTRKWKGIYFQQTLEIVDEKRAESGMWRGDPKKASPRNSRNADGGHSERPHNACHWYRK